jgi:esterase
MKLHFRRYGVGEAVIILHGLFGSLDNWHSISARLGAGWQVYAVDLRNHGRSPHISEMSYPAMAEDVRELLEDQQLRSASLIGHSIGGKVAMQFALSHPRRLEKLVVADIAPRAYPPHHQYIFRALLSLDVAGFKARSEIERALAQEIPDLALRQFLLKSLERDESGNWRWRLNLPALHAHYAELCADLPSDKSCDRPALFLRGSQSDYIRPEDEHRIRQLFTKTSIRTLPGAGHWLHAEVPESFLRNVQEFLRG